MQFNFEMTGTTKISNSHCKFIISYWLDNQYKMDYTMGVNRNRTEAVKSRSLAEDDGKPVRLG